MRSCSRPERRIPLSSAAGFTLIEVLAVLLLTGLLVSGMTILTGQWMRSWNRGASVLQNAETLAVGLDRIRSDIASSLPLSILGAQPSPGFIGTSTELRFVHSARDRHALPGLEIVAFGPSDDGRGLTRSRTEYLPAVRLEDANPQDATLVIRSPYRAKFSFLDAEGSAQEDWRQLTPPTAVRISLTADDPHRWPGLSTTIPVRAQIPSLCANEQSFARCLDIAAGRANGASPADKAAESDAPQSGASFRRDASR